MLGSFAEWAVIIAGVLCPITECTKQLCLGMLEMLSGCPQWRVMTICTSSCQIALCHLWGLSRWVQWLLQATPTPPMTQRNHHYTSTQFKGNIPFLHSIWLSWTRWHHFAVMHGETGFTRIDSSFPEIKGHWASLDAFSQTTHELTILNSLISYVVRGQGTNINEICQMSRAQIKTADPMEGGPGRQIAITDSVARVSGPRI